MSSYNVRFNAHLKVKQIVENAVLGAKVQDVYETKKGRITLRLGHDTLSKVSLLPTYKVDADGHETELLSVSLYSVTFMPDATFVQISTALKALLANMNIP